MHLDEAIHLLSLHLPSENWKVTPKLKKAVMLCIQASIRIQHSRKHGIYAEIGQLPGETKEN